MIDTLSFSLSPLIQSDSAISLAKQTMKYDNTCISYRLGIYGLNAAIGYSTPDYKLVWKIQGDNGFPFVVLDATNGQVYSKDDGIRY